MIDVTKILKDILNKCLELEELENRLHKQYENQTSQINQEAIDLIYENNTNYENFKNDNFGSIDKNIDNLINILKKDYPQVSNIKVDSSEYENNTYEENKGILKELIAEVNIQIDKLNNVNFGELVPPRIIETKKEKVIVSSFDINGALKEVKEYDYTKNKLENIQDPKPLEDIVPLVAVCCRKIQGCLKEFVKQYDEMFDIDSFNKIVLKNKEELISQLESTMRTNFNNKYEELFINDKKSSLSKNTFISIEEEGKKYKVDKLVGTSEYNEGINLGNVEFVVSSKERYLEYINNSPVLKKYVTNGILSTPLVINLKEVGNILLNINEEQYSEDTVKFVNQMIIQFLLSFPANRINFCLIDIDNKMGFSQFKSLTKINNNILFNGIIRDDRQLENTIKDMEQTMYKIDDDILSYNNMENIYEYNKNFEANPQNVHLFVLVNYPSGMREELTKRISKIIQNGRKAGIFSIIINNKACPLNMGFKDLEHEQFINNASSLSLVINKIGRKFSINSECENEFVPVNDIDIASLPAIIEMLKENKEMNSQKVIPLSQMFEEANKIENNKYSSAEVLDIPIGARGGDVQNLLLKTTGDGSAHAVVIGGTGSGKSNLLHTIIMSACYKYSPEELNLYIVDFKGGVEFKYYEANKIVEKQIPHIKLTGLTSDLEDGVAILNNLHKELRKREDEFRRCRVEDIVQYRNLGYKIPRLFVIIDEIQELFEQDDKLGQKAIDILRELFKKGRAFGINILWASQNIPSVPGLKDKVLSQIGNRISLRLNEPEDALDIKIDPKIVKNLNRPEKGLGVINDIRYGNDSVEFRVAYAENSENRQKYSQEIIDKWAYVTKTSPQQPLFIVGDDEEPSPVLGETIYSIIPNKDSIVSKSFDNYTLQIGQDYVTGQAYDIDLAVRENKMNAIIIGPNQEINRDIMGYSLLSTTINHITNKDCVKERSKIYYANGEMINPKNQNALFNVMRQDFDGIIENVSSKKDFSEGIKKLYKLYLDRKNESENSEYAKTYTPQFITIHSLQRYLELFSENPSISLKEETPKTENTLSMDPNQSLEEYRSQRVSPFARSSFSTTTFKTDTISFVEAFKELLSRGGALGIHFIISMDNPQTISEIRKELSDIEYKVFTSGINGNIIVQMLDDYRMANSLTNSKVALVCMRDEKIKVRLYRYEQNQDEVWYKKISKHYNDLWRNN